MKTPREAIERMCLIRNIAYHSIENYTKPCDGFCHKCILLFDGAENFKATDEIYDYIQQAVIEKLQRDGHKIMMPDELVINAYSISQKS